MKEIVGLLLSAAMTCCINAAVFFGSIGLGMYVYDRLKEDRSER